MGELALSLRRCGLAIELGPAEGVVPGLADEAVAVVFGGRRGRSSPAKTSRVSRPQRPRYADPVDGLVDHGGRPLVGLAGADADPVATGVVDEGDLQRLFDSFGVAAGTALSQRLTPEAAEERRHVGDGTEELEAHAR